MAKNLTKSKFLKGLDAEALLWRVVNQPETIPPPNDIQQKIFDAGNEIGILAQQYFPDGIDLGNMKTEVNLEATQQALQERKPIFEAGFLAGRCLARVDVLLPVNTDEWDIIEVKSSTKFKDTYINDLAFQRYVLESCGLKIRESKLMLLNNTYIKQGEISIPDLFYFDNSKHEKVSNFLLKVPALAQRMLEVIDLPACPKFELEDLAKGTYSNVFKDEFKAALPRNTIFELHGLRTKKKLEWWQSGIHMIVDMPIDSKTPE